MHKGELHRVYRQLPVNPADVSISQYNWKGSIYFETVLSMGIISVIFPCQWVTSAIPYTHNSLPGLKTYYLDDFIVAPKLGKAQMDHSIIIQCI